MQNNHQQSTDQQVIRLFGKDRNPRHML